MPRLDTVLHESRRGLGDGQIGSGVQGGRTRALARQEAVRLELGQLRGRETGQMAEVSRRKRIARVITGDDLGVTAAVGGTPLCKIVVFGFVVAQIDTRTRGGRMLVVGLGDVEGRDVADAARWRGRPGRVFDGPALETIADDSQRQEVLALFAKDDAQQIDVVVVELSVPAGGSLGVDQALALEESDLRDRDVGKLFEQQSEHFADGQVGTI